MTRNETVLQWWAMLSEAERKKLVERFPGSIAYNLTKSWFLLPEPARQAVEKAYAARFGAEKGGTQNG